jgi:type I restriction enzyme S subunit
LAEVKAGLTRIYGARLQGVYLFGSYARDEADAESDFDVLVVLDDFAAYGAEVDRTAELVATLSLANEVSISTVFVRAADWRAAQTPFLANVRAEAVAA